MKLQRNNLRVSSSLENNKKLHKKITEHIKGIIQQNNSTLVHETNKNAEKIPERIVMKSKQTIKYLHKKKLINNKFEWLNKYIEHSELQSLPISIEPSNHSKCGDKENQELYGQNLERNKRSKTQVVQDSDQQGRLSLACKDQKFIGQRKSENQNHYRLLKEMSLNGRILSEKNFKLGRSKSIKDRKNVFALGDENAKPFMSKQKVIGLSNPGQRNLSISNHSEDKENIKNVESKNLKDLKKFIDENTPTREFLGCTARLNSSNLMFKNKSGYLKNKKRQYIFQSREQKRQQSELLRIKQRFEEDITVEPWNLNGNDKDQNQETDFNMRNYQ